MFWQSDFNQQQLLRIAVLDRALLHLSAKVKPSEETLAKHRLHAQLILQRLQAKSTYKIDRMVFAGSFGKKTNIAQSDADCVFFINDQEPPFDRVLEEFYNICNVAEFRKSFDKFVVKLNNNSISFHINGFKMDLVLAPNFVEKGKKFRSLPHVQQKEALRRIKMEPAENSYKYSSALAESSVLFMKNRDGFANDMARIAKHWFQSLDRNFEHISGASTFIELVAVHATTRKMMKKKKRNVYFKAFIIFLELLKYFEQLDVSFGSCNEHRPVDYASPRVIDPVNPYNNFARYWREHSRDIQAIKESSALTLLRVQELISIPTADKDDMIKNIFRH